MGWGVNGDKEVETHIFPTNAYYIMSAMCQTVIGRKSFLNSLGITRREMGQ